MNRTYYTAFGATDSGKKRDNNEDAFFLLPKKSLYIISDGMGGHNAGEVASRTAVEAVKEYFSLKDISSIEPLEKGLVDAVIFAHKKVMHLSSTHKQYYGMGCTIVIAYIRGNLLHTCHVGDSRAYVAGKTGIQHITSDHSLVNELVKDGLITSRDARHSDKSNILRRAVGISLGMIPEYTSSPIDDGDTVLLCTDGLWNMLPDDEILQVVLAGDNTPKQICRNLIEKANEAGGRDNITVIAIRK